VKQKLDSLSALLKIDEVEQIPQLRKVADKVGVKVATLIMVAGGLVLLFLVYMASGYMVQWFLALFGFIPATYSSMKALNIFTRPAKSLSMSQMERHETARNAVTQWLTYWVVYSVLQLLQPVLSFVPYNSVIQFALYVYMMHPKLQGA